VDNDGVGQSLQLELAQGFEIEATARSGQEPDHVGGEDLTSIATRTEPRRFDDRDSVVIPGVGLHLANGQSNSHRHRLRGGGTGRHGLLHPDGAGEAGRHPAERHHEPVAGALDLLPLRVRHHGPQPCEVLPS